MQVAYGRRSAPAMTRSLPTAARVVLGAGARGAIAAAACQVLAFGVAVFLWAIGAAGVGTPPALLRGSLTAVAAANGMPVRIGDATLTLPPLALAVLGAVLLWVGIGRGGPAPVGPAQAALAVLSGAAAYAVMVTVVSALAGTPHAVSAAYWWRPALMALLVLAVAVGRQSDLILSDRVKLWARLCGLGLSGLTGGAAVVLVVSLIMSLTAATKVGEALAPGVADGIGLLVLCLAFFPNALICAFGYASGAGFSVGAASFSPFGSTTGSLPAVPLLAAVPEHAGASPLGLLALLVPLGTGALLGWLAARRLEFGANRLLICAAATLAIAVTGSLIAGLAGGGVTGGRWADSGVSPLRLMLFLIPMLLLPAAAVALALPAAGWREQSGSARAARPDDIPDPGGDADLVETGAADEPAGEADRNEDSEVESERDGPEDDDRREEGDTADAAGDTEAAPDPAGSDEPGSDDTVEREQDEGGEHPDEMDDEAERAEKTVTAGSAEEPVEAPERDDDRDAGPDGNQDGDNEVRPDDEEAPGGPRSGSDQDESRRERRGHRGPRGQRGSRGPRR